MRCLLSHPKLGNGTMWEGTNEAVLANINSPWKLASTFSSVLSLLLHHNHTSLERKGHKARIQTRFALRLLMKSKH